MFKEFLKGDSLEECYESVGDVGNYWLDMIDSRGVNVDDDELMGYISEKKTISKTIDEYEGRKATSLTTAQRLADFLGTEMVKDKGSTASLSYPSTHWVPQLQNELFRRPYLGPTKQLKSTGYASG